MFKLRCSNERLTRLSLSLTSSEYNWFCIDAAALKCLYISYVLHVLLKPILSASLFCCLHHLPKLNKNQFCCAESGLGCQKSFIVCEISKYTHCTLCCYSWFALEPQLFNMADSVYWCHCHYYVFAQQATGLMSPSSL